MQPVYNLLSALGIGGYMLSWTNSCKPIMTVEIKVISFLNERGPKQATIYRLHFTKPA
jgi:hypothetical protein